MIVKPFRLIASGVLIICCAFDATGQNDTIDSLRNWIDNYTASDTVLVDNYNELAYAFFSIDPQKTLLYSDSAEALSKSLNYKFGIASANTTRGIYYWAIGDMHSALMAYLKAAELYEELGRTNGEIATYINLGLIYRGQYMIEDAKTFFLKALELAKAHDYEEAIASASLNAGVTLFSDLGKYEEGLHYLLEAQKYIANQKVDRKLADNYNNIGETYFHLLKTDLASAYFDSAMAVATQLNDQRAIATTHRNKALIYLREKDYQNAFANLETAVEVSSESSLNALLASCYGRLSDVMYEIGNFKAATDYSRLHIEISESLRNDEKDKQFNFLTKRFESEQKEKEITQQRLQLIYQESQLKTLQYVIYVSLAVVIIAAIIFFLIYKQLSLRRSKQLLDAQINTLKNQLSPHFLFNSLNVVSGIIQKDPNKADDCIHELAKTYKIILQSFNEELVSIETELELVKSYLNILKYRYGDAFEVNFNISNPNIMVPPLSLQLTVENAFKHNIVSMEKPLVIHVSDDADFLVITNNYQPISEKPFSASIGFDSLKKRYAMLTNRLLEIMLTEYEYVVKLPLLRVVN
ncbi:MAG: tetratricopeptide repeat protein [Cyclobacteriaceae bacterium]